MGIKIPSNVGSEIIVIENLNLITIFHVLLNRRKYNKKIIINIFYFDSTRIGFFYQNISILWLFKTK